MDVEKIYFISAPSPTLGRHPISGTGDGLFGYYRREKYITCLQEKLKSEEINWTVEIDNTESDIEKIIKQGVKLLICAPGLRFQFYTNGFDKNNIIYLSTMDYVTNNTNSVISKIKEIYNEKRT